MIEAHIFPNMYSGVVVRRCVLRWGSWYAVLTLFFGKAHTHTPQYAANTCARTCIRVYMKKLLVVRRVYESHPHKASHTIRTRTLPVAAYSKRKC